MRDEVIFLLGSGLRQGAGLGLWVSWRYFLVPGDMHTHGHSGSSCSGGGCLLTVNYRKWLSSTCKFEKKRKRNQPRVSKNHVLQGQSMAYASSTLKPIPERLSLWERRKSLPVRAKQGLGCSIHGRRGCVFGNCCSAFPHNFSMVFAKPFSQEAADQMWHPTFRKVSAFLPQFSSWVN